MIQKTKIIDIANISLFLEHIASDQQQEGQELIHTYSDADKNPESDKQSVQSVDTRSSISKQTQGLSQGHEYNIDDKEVQGLILNKASQSDMVNLKLIYLIDPNISNGFLVLSETNMSLANILDTQD